MTATRRRARAQGSPGQEGKKSSLFPGPDVFFLVFAATKGAQMDSQILGLKVASFIFGVISLLQLLRLVMRVEISVAGSQLALWPSAVAVVVLGGLSLWLWKLARSAAR
jgi:hypothetical protein